MVKPFGLDDLHRARDRSRQEPHVRVCEQQQVAARPCGARLERVVLPKPTRRERLHVDDLNTRVGGCGGVGDRAGGVGRSVVDDDDLE